MTQPLLIAGSIILVIFAVIVVHEAGHFLVGKLSGIRVDEFSVGFGPKFLSRRRGETLYALRVLPLGGFVRMAGMLGLPGEADAGERNFYRATIPRRFATIAAGIVFNFAFAIVCFTIVNLAVPGKPWSVLPGEPAAEAGVPNGAVVTSVGGRRIRDDSQDAVTEDLHAATRASDGRPVTLTYRTADGVDHSTVVTPTLVLFNAKPTRSLPAGDLVVTRVDGHSVGTGGPAQVLGGGRRVSISGYAIDASGKRKEFADAQVSGVSDAYESPLSPLQAVWRLGISAGFPGQSLPTAVVNASHQIPTFIVQTATGLYQLITVPSLGGVNGPAGLSGPIGIATATATAEQNGFLSDHGLVWWIGFISMNLGLINVLPIPFLDGGKLMLLGLEAVRRKRLDPQHEAIISAVGLALVAMLLVYVTIGDVNRLTSQ